ALRLIGLYDLAHPVDGLRLRLVIRAHEHLPEEPDRHELDADDHHEDAEQDDRPIGERLSEEDSLEAEHPFEREAAEGAEEADQAEEMDRPGRIPREELDGQEIEQHAQRPREAV